MLRKLNLRCLNTKKVFYKGELSKFSHSFLGATNATYIESLYKSWLADPKSVPASWDAYFHNDARDLSQEESFQLPEEGMQINVQGGTSNQNDIIRVQMMILAFRQYGHQIAAIDPLMLDRKIYQQQQMIEKYDESTQRLNPEYYGFSKQDMEKEYNIFYKNLGGLNRNDQSMKLKDLYAKLEDFYTQTVGHEFYYIENPEERNFLLDQIESDAFRQTSKERKLQILHNLCENEQFNLFLKTKFPTSKRFGIEGCDTTISGLKTLVEIAGEHKADHLVFGMAHRGRLNTLALVFQKPFAEIFAEFKEAKKEQQGYDDNVWGQSGDVKYHLGMTSDIKTKEDHSIRLSILPNPSHLETVDPLVYGKTRAIQDFEDDKDRKKNIGVILHGDAAHAGQGIVYETYQFQDLKDYTSGGMIHIVTNNQIGFTTSPRDGRSGLYSTEVAKTIGAPIFHVNSDDPEMIDRVMRLAFEYRQKFNKDVVIDIIGYRRYGHNELDQPSFTQPLMYKKISALQDVYQLYAAQMIQEGVINQTEKKQMEESFLKLFENALDESRANQIPTSSWPKKSYEQMIISEKWGKIKDTGVPTQHLQEVSKKMFDLSSIKAHPQINKIFQGRLKSVQEGEIDYGTAEHLAYYTLLEEGFGVRLSGQDVERGTFSHRHAVVHDQDTGKTIKPIDSVTGEQNKFIVTNSHLSEYGVLGFEYGYNIANPNYLVMWEAQFGDFANTAQIMIDNYIVSGESKWGQQSGLVMLLPHGMDGNGPEHSSARLERFLQLSDDSYKLQTNYKYEDGKLKGQISNTNMQVVCPTTSASYFHVLRRQLRRDYRKPLIVFNSKKLLKYRPAISKLAEFEEGSRFQWLIPDNLPKEKITQVAFCSGQVYYDALDARTERGDETLALVRLEQLSPFPYDQVKHTIEKYPGAKLVWLQEEHQNSGAYSYVKSRFENVISRMGIDKVMHYVGRSTSASTATGSGKTHQAELKSFIEQLF